MVNGEEERILRKFSEAERELWRAMYGAFPVAGPSAAGEWRPVPRRCQRSDFAPWPVGGQVEVRRTCAVPVWDDLGHPYRNLGIAARVARCTQATLMRWIQQGKSDYRGRRYFLQRPARPAKAA